MSHDADAPGPPGGGAAACTDPVLREKLGSWELGLLGDDEAVRVEAHVLSCPACFVELYETAPATERIVGEPLAGGSVTPLPRRRPRPWLVLAGSLAASIAVVAILAALLRAPGGGVAPAPGRHEPPPTRSGAADEAIAALSPIGAVARPGALDWEPVPGARRYDVRLSTARGRLAWSATVEAPPATLPDEVRDSLEPGATYYWQVEVAHDAGPTRVSELTRFTLAR